MEKNCKNCDKKFEILDDDIVFYGKINVSIPTFCPRCRSKRRMTFWNMRSLFHKTDAHS